MAGSERDHWQRVHTEKAENQVGWFQERPRISLELIAESNVGYEARIIDVGGGASRLVDVLLDQGFRKLTVLDIAAGALERVRLRLGARAREVRFVEADVTSWASDAQYDLWHDRAAFHFLCAPEQRAAYVSALTRALRVGGQAVIGTFAIDGPARCSGLPVVRYDAQGLSSELGARFHLLESKRDLHVTPGGVAQPFLFCRFQRLGDSVRAR